MLSSALLSVFSTAAFVAGAPTAPILDVANAVDVIAENFIVVMKSGMSDSDFLSHLTSRHSAIISGTKSTFNLGSFKGYSGVFSQSIVDIITSSLDIAYLEPDARVKASALITQVDAPSWGLGRISHREPGISDYIYDESAGAGTFAYVIDTGVYTEHQDFGGRAQFGANFAGDGKDFDGNGHGTHVSGTIGSSTYGVAKKTQIIGVKVLDVNGSGSSSSVISGIDFAVNDATRRGRIGKAVANLSLGSIFSRASNDAVAAAVSAGLFMGVAAGNDGLPAGLFSPASEPSACTVGATVNDDSRASYSNFGSVVDIFAPGSDILSTWINGPTDTKIISGTSMATPHVVGLGAYLIGLEGASEPKALCQRIRTLATKNALSGVSGLNGLVPGLLGTPNLLAYNGNGA